MPDHQEPITYAVFAHCFTCSKNLSVVRQLTRALNEEGIAVLRFDFTGLGDSEGEFADTNFSSNVSDLINAVEYLSEQGKKPEIMIGHSLGGTAVLMAASQLDQIRAVVTIGSPANPEHVKHHFSDKIEKINKKGEAQVDIGGRDFRVKKQFLEDIEQTSMQEVIASLRRPLAIFHSPQDETVGVENAKEIYEAAMHPKSFISLDGADHLLSDKKDAAYVGSVIAGWVSRYIQISEVELPKTDHQVAASLGQKGFTTTMVAGKHKLIADEPEQYGGDDFGPSPYGYLSAALASCTAMTLRMYADRKEWNLEKVVVHVDHKKDHCKDCENLEDPGRKIDTFQRKIELKGDLDDSQKKKLLEIADKCPVHKTLHLKVEIRTELV